ncbi:MAG: hypothetical protein ABJL54_13635 [Halioglobus sp.]
MHSRGKIFGEFLLIVIGVLAALMLEALMSERHDKSLEAEYLSRLESDITKDKLAFTYRIEFFSSVQAFSQEFLEWLHSDSVMDKRVLLAAFYAAEVWPYELTKSTYQDLQSTGNLRLIEEVALRANLIQYYNRADARDDYWNPSAEYRKSIRGLIPTKVQGQIREKCPTTDRQDLVPTGFPPCDLQGVDLDRLAILFEPLRNDPNFLKALTYRHSELGVAVRLFEQQVAFADEILVGFDE